MHVSFVKNYTKIVSLVKSSAFSSNFNEGDNFFDVQFTLLYKDTNMYVLFLELQYVK